MFYVVIMAGGIGSRLWPLSTEKIPKHLIEFKDSCLLQQAYSRAKNITNDVFILTEEVQSKQIQEVIPSAKLIIEPKRNGTGNAFLLAIHNLNPKDTDVVLFIHADHFIENDDDFKKSIESAKQIAKKTNSIILIGIEPTYPATKYGYIKVGEKYENYYNVEKFVEKPNEDKAIEFLNSKLYKWNSGYFIATGKTFKEQINLHLNSNYSSINDYENLKYSIIDYDLLEKSKDLKLISAEFTWADVGTYNDLLEKSEKNQHDTFLSGNIISDSKNSYISNKEDKKLIVIGLDDVVVVNTKDGILVSKKELVDDIKKILEKN